MASNSSTQQFRDVNPCTEESENSLRCLDTYNNKNMCSGYFSIYKNCRKYWHGVMLQRRRNGVEPEMPNEEERKNIIAALGGKPY